MLSLKTMDTTHQKSILELEKNFSKQIKNIKDADSLEVLRAKYLGRQGEINALFKSLPLKGNPQIGKSLNQAKQKIAQAIEDAMREIQTKRGDSSFDPTVPGETPPQGSLHLITQAIEEIEQIFARLGFARRRYLEVDTDWYYAEGLNIPKDHPARDDQETFYVDGGAVLTAHTSNGQLHEMEYKKVPPIKMVNISKTYRRQADATHNSMFHQFEGLVIDKGINITHLIGVTEFFAKSYFGQDRRIRLRPHHFQFTEPSFEIDISCDICQGSGYVDKDKCKICKSGWLELGGAGMVHPNVLNNGGVDPQQYSGFAFGWGVERVLMMKSGLNIPDLRLLYGDDLRFLSQF